MVGSWVETGDILVGKLTPQSANESLYDPEDRLLRAILGIQVSTSKETCLKLPIGGRGRVIDVRWEVRKKKKGESGDNEPTRSPCKIQNRTKGVTSSPHIKKLEWLRRACNYFIQSNQH